MADLFASDTLAEINGDKRAIKASHLDGSETLRAGQEIVVWDEQVPADKVRWFGYGGEDQAFGVAHMYADLKSPDDSDSDSTVEDVEGDVIIRVTDSTGRKTLAEKELGDLGTLRDAANQKRTERPNMPAMAPYANPDRRIQIAIVADSASDGVQLDTAASSCRFWFTQN